MFNEKYRKEYKVTVADDMRENSDFSGAFCSDVSRFNVTVNLYYKKLEDCEPFLCEDPAFSVAMPDPSNKKISDVVSLTFKCCNCGVYKLPFILLMGRSYDAYRESKGLSDQLFLNICNNCCEFEETERHTHNFLYSPTEFFNELPDNMKAKYDPSR